MTFVPPTPVTVGRAPAVTFTVGRPTAAALTVRGYGGSLVRVADLVLLTEAGDFLTLESGEFLLTA